MDEQSPVGRPQGLSPVSQAADYGARFNNNWLYLRQMDVERTIEFILQMQAAAEVRMAKADERAAKHDERMAKHDERAAKADERMDKFDKRLEATRKLVEAGMKLITKKHIQIAGQISALAEQQRKTERTLDRFIVSMSSRRSNGHKA